MSLPLLPISIIARLSVDFSLVRYMCDAHAPHIVYTTMCDALAYHHVWSTCDSSVIHPSSEAVDRKSAATQRRLMVSLEEINSKNPLVAQVGVRRLLRQAVCREDQLPPDDLFDGGTDVETADSRPSPPHHAGAASTSAAQSSQISPFSPSVGNAS